MTIKNDGVNLSPLHMFFSLFLILLNSNWLYCYRGVYRFPNGTDVELYRLNNGACEKVLLGEKRHDPVPNYCGYECNRNLNQTSSVYKLKNVISGCEKDFLILQNERCSVAIGTNWKKNEVNTIEIHNIDKKFLYYKNTKASRCTLKNECSVKYRNFTSGWQVFSYGDCFKFEVVDDNSKATAQININCVPAHQKHLAGQMFRIELECHMDSQNKTVDTCLLFKIPGLYIVNDSISLLSTQVCVTPLPPVIPTTADPLKSDDNFMSPYGWIIIGVILALILLAIIICIFIYCSRKKRYNVDSKSESQASDITAGGIFPVLSVKHGQTSMTTAREWFQMNGDQDPDNIDGAVNDDLPVTEIISERSHGLNNPLFEADEFRLEENSNAFNFKTPVAMKYAKVNKSIDKSGEEESIYEEIPTATNASEENKDEEIDIVKLLSSGNDNKKPEDKIGSESAEQPMTAEEAESVLQLLDDWDNNPKEPDSNRDYDDVNDGAFEGDDEDQPKSRSESVSSSSTADLAKLDVRNGEQNEDQTGGSENTNSDTEGEPINLPPSILNKISFWKSKALKRTTSDMVKPILDRDESLDSSAGSLTEEGSEIACQHEPKTQKEKPIKPKRSFRRRIKSGDGDLDNVHFENPKDGHIYYNNSSVVLTQPLSRYSDSRTDDTDDASSSDDEDGDINNVGSGRLSPPPHGSASVDLPLLNPDDTQENEYKVPLPVNTPIPDNMPRTNLHDCYSTDFLIGGQGEDDLYMNPVNRYNEDFYDVPTTTNVLADNYREFDWDFKEEQGVDEPPPMLPPKVGNDTEEDQVYDKVSWPPLAAFSSDSHLNFYNVVPIIKGDTKESVMINFRRPIPMDIKLTRLPYSQFNYGSRNTRAGNSSCNGFCLALANYFLQQHRFPVLELISQVPLLLKESEAIWKDLNIGSTTVDEAFRILKNVDPEIIVQIGNEIFWSIDQGVGGNSPFEALHDIYDYCVNSCDKECLIFTFYPDKSCICLFDEAGTQYFIDGHIHFKTNNQERHAALDDPDCGGVIATTVKSKSDVMLNFILTNMCLEMKADSKNGTVMPITHKDKFITEL